MAEYSWQRHLIGHGTYADWVDRGRLRPTHRQWSAYLRDVAERAAVEIVTGEVTGLEATGEADGKAGREAAGKSDREAAGKAGREAGGKSDGEAAGKSIREAAGKSIREAAGKSIREAAGKSIREAAGHAGREAAGKSGGETGGVRWRLALGPGRELLADGVVFTGAGPPIRVAGQPREHPRVFDGRSYWLAEPMLDEQVARSVCVIGSGETAASVVVSLLTKAHKRSTVNVLTSRGVLYSRGESYDENRFYSDPGDWPRLAETHRREFLERTDRGVFSPQAEAILNASRGFRTLAGRAVRIDAGASQVVVTIEYGSARERVAYDLVVVAIGFDARWFEGLLGAEARRRLGSALGETPGGTPGAAAIERRIGLDLSVEGLSPPLHLPLLAGLAQGPGFPNLSCLGLLSDRILRRYVVLGEPAGAAAERRELV